MKNEQESLFITHHTSPFPLHTLINKWWDSSLLAIHIASRAYDKSYDNRENSRETLDSCGEQ